MSSAESETIHSPTILPSIKDSSALAQDAHHLMHVSSSYPWRNNVRRHQRAVQLLSFIRTNQKRYPVTAFVTAVVILQRIWRGVICRRRLLRALRAKRQTDPDTKIRYNAGQTLTQMGENSNLSNQPCALPWPAFSQRAANFERCLRICEVMQTSEDANQQQKGSNEDDLLRALEIEAAAKSLQQRVRALLMHREVQVWWLRERWPIFFVAAVTIQRAWMTYCIKRKMEKKDLKMTSQGMHSDNISKEGGYLLNTEAQLLQRKLHRRFFLTKADSAAARIQDWWRRCLQKKIFQYFVRVIRDSATIVSTNNAANHNYGRSKTLKPFIGTHSNTITPDTSSQRTAHALLKQIDFGEACMLQSQGSGLHVRFRLAHGGVVPFPPVIVFKVSTHAHVLDMGLFAPKDYVLEGRKAQERRRQPIIIHNKPETISHQRKLKLAATFSPSSPTHSPHFPASPGHTKGTSDISVSGAQRIDYVGTGTVGSRVTLNKNGGKKGPAPNPLSWISNGSPKTDLIATEFESSRYERRDNNPWRLADTNAMADGNQLEVLLANYEASARRSHLAAKAARELREANGSGKRSTLDLATVTSKQLVSASRSQAATGTKKRAAIEDAVIATQRRWLAELYASEKVFEFLKVANDNKKKAHTESNDETMGPFMTGTKIPSIKKGTEGSSSYYYDTKTKAELLFRNVPITDLQDEVAKVRGWHEALDYASYRAAWLALGTST